MKKPYYTKFIVSDEPIQEGDWILDRSLNMKVKLSDKANVKAVQLNQFKDTYKKLVLTLISRDITHIRLLTIPMDQQQWQEQTSKEKDDCFLNWGFYNEVASLSSDALAFVNEYDEFNEDEIQYFIIDPGEDKHWGPYQLENPRDNKHWNESPYKVVKIKGSCTHFH